MGVMEDVADAAASAFGDLAGAFGRANAGVLGSLADTLAEVVNALDRMKGDEVSGAFAGAFGNISGSAACAFTDVAGTGPDVAARAAGWLGAAGRGRRRIGLLLLSVCDRAREGCGREDGGVRETRCEMGCA